MSHFVPHVGQAKIGLWCPKINDHRNYRNNARKFKLPGLLSLLFLRLGQIGTLGQWDVPA
jgi:hypothetical protein